MNLSDTKVFDTSITTVNAATHKDAPQQNVIFVASITVAGREVFTRYYTNNTQAQMVLFSGPRSKETTRLAVYDHVEAEAWLLQDFGSFLAKKWTE
jgi:hypothetical protein